MTRQIMAFCLLILISSRYAAAGDFTLIIDTIKNLTEAINNADQNMQTNTAEITAQLKVFSDTWPGLMAQMEEMSNIPDAIYKLIDTVNVALPKAEACVYTLGACLVTGSLIYSATKLFIYFRHRRLNSSTNLLY